MLAKLGRFLRAPLHEKSRYVSSAWRTMRQGLGDRLPWSVKNRLHLSLSSINQLTIDLHGEVADRAIEASRRPSNLALSEVGEQHDALMKTLRSRFEGVREGTQVRVLIHMPPPEVALAGFSSATNLIQGLQYLGVPCRELGWDEESEDVFRSFRPSVLMTSWHPLFLDRIDWKSVARFRETAPFLVGLNAAEDEIYGADLVAEILEWSTSNEVAFFFKERPTEYVDSHYETYRRAGFPVVAIDYAANPLLYFPTEWMSEKLDYVFLGSLHRDKWRRYLDYFSPIISKYRGFLIGPGWPTGPPTTIAPSTHRFLYAGANVGLNLHHETQINEPVELNERTYSLAASGIPQLVDKAFLLTRRFSDDAFFVADKPDDYLRGFEVALNDRVEANRRALVAHKEVLESHTVFHRADEAHGKFLGMLDGKASAKA